MKTGIIKAIFILFIATNLALTAKNKNTEDPTKVIATFQGFDDSGYTFSFTNDDDDEEVITFETVSEKILKTYNLKDSKFINQEFEITYDYQASEEDEEVEVLVLQSIKKIE